MTRHCLKPTIRTIAGLATCLLFAITAIPLNAQPPLAWGYDKAHEVTLTGTIAAVNEKAPRNSPVGLHLMLSAPQGQVDAHLGPYMTKATIEALHTGIPVQIVGAMETVHGKQYLLARQIIFSGRLVQVRSENGFLMQEHSAKSLHRDQKSGVKGGAR